MNIATAFLRRPASRAVLLALPVLLSACANMPGAKDPRDPLEPFNREMTQFNEGFDSMLLKPVATAYRNNVPPLVRTGVSNFFGNLRDVWSAVNSLLQFRLRDAEESIARVHVNTMFGVFGIFDVASELNIERHREDFGQTLGRWGMPPGPYIVLPFLGPSTLRDTVALPVDYRGDLIQRLPSDAASDTLYVLRAVDARSNLLRLGNVIEQAALDKYTFTRDAYLQRRRAEIFDYRSSDNDGSEPPADEPQAPEPGQPASGPAR